MSGHSKWSTIRRQKGAADIKRGMVFTKIANTISVAVRLGGSADPDSNPRLRSALDSARKVNMPRENVTRAIDRGLGKLPGQVLEEVVYEGFGPNKVAFYIEGVTDNKLRTNSEIRNLFERAGGSLGGAGSTLYMFDKKGEIKIKNQISNIKTEEEVTLELIDLGVEDIESFEEDGIRKYLVYIESPELNTMSNKITQVGFEVESAEITYKPKTMVKISEKEAAKKVLNFTEKLEEHPDIQKVYVNFDIPDNLINSNI